ncbi:MAG: HD-GYP domain-containing protein [Candidatus Aminicenantes bacterium]|nr:MAG: HD-GYP domain-containing protein [Candidatus Aminicenantes bacterium]
MVRLSDILRKAEESKSQGKENIVTEAVKLKKEMESLPGTKKIYEDVIVRIKTVQSDIRAGNVVDGKEIFAAARKIVGGLRTNYDMLLSLLNIFTSFEETEDFHHRHSVNSAILAASLGFALEYKNSMIVDLCVCALVHDIGMLKIPQEIINKTSKLSKEDEKLIETHPGYGLELLENVKDLPDEAGDVIYQHHERVDGKGYPEGKTGEQISEFSKVVAITEVYEALTHPRPYRKEKVTPYEGVKMIVEQAGTFFESRLVKVFLTFITPYPLGSFVLINNNEIGRVVKINKGLPLRPLVEIYYDSEGKPPDKPKNIDLAKSPVLYIEKALAESYL